MHIGRAARRHHGQIQRLRRCGTFSERVSEVHAYQERFCSSPEGHSGLLPPLPSTMRLLRCRRYKPQAHRPRECICSFRACRIERARGCFGRSPTAIDPEDTRTDSDRSGDAPSPPTQARVEGASPQWEKADLRARFQYLSVSLSFACLRRQTRSLRHRACLLERGKQAAGRRRACFAIGQQRRRPLPRRFAVED